MRLTRTVVYVAILVGPGFWMGACSDDDDNNGQQDAAVVDASSHVDGSGQEDGTVQEDAQVEVDGAVGPMTVSEWEEAYVDTLCSYYVRCHLLEEVGMPMGLDNCKRFFRMLDLDNFAGVLELSVERGTLTIDRDAVERCMSAWDQMDCVDNGYQDFEELDGCGEMFVGTQTEGNECNTGFECVSGWCDSRAACPGVCAQPAQLGEPCEWGRHPCADGLVCEDSGGNNTCVEQPTPGQENETCDPDNQNTCMGGLFCSQSDSMCHAQVGEGEACEQDAACGPGVVCGSEGLCVQVQVLTQADQTCSYDDGIFCDVDSNLACSYDSQADAFVCTPFAGPNESCEGDPAAFCGPFDETFCDSDSGLCAEKRADGQPCEWDGQCQGHCDSASGVCVSNPPCK